MGMGILLALVMSALLWAASQSAQAQTVDESQAQIAALRMQTEEAPFIGQNDAKVEAGLIGKLDGASVKR
jgi:hypothetical protein